MYNVGNWRGAGKSGVDDNDEILFEVLYVQLSPNVKTTSRMIQRHVMRGVRTSPILFHHLQRSNSIWKCAECSNRPAVISITSSRDTCSIVRHFSAKAKYHSVADQLASEPADLTISEYHQKSDAYIDSVVEALEDMAEQREEIDVEYHVYSSSLSTARKLTSLVRSSEPRLSSCWNICHQ